MLKLPKLLRWFPTPTYGNHFGTYNFKGGKPVDDLDWAAMMHDAELEEADRNLAKRLTEIEPPKGWWGKLCYKYAKAVFKGE